MKACFFLRCARDGCCGAETDCHTTKDMDFVVNDSKETFELWNSSQRESINLLTDQVPLYHTIVFIISAAILL